MAITVFDSFKKRKRTPKIYSINDSATRTSMDTPGPFRDNIRLFLRSCGDEEEYQVSGNSVWCTLLASKASGVVFPVYILEEDVKGSSNPLCDFCRCVGWGHHYVSKRRYHFIIPTEDKWHKRLTKECLNLTSHLLHGLIHCNGFGHLLCINSAVSESNYLPGDEIMDIWDHLCTTLQARKISLDDASKKRSMDLRLLHGVAYGRPWFGKWGYRFSHGSFGVTKEKYERAIQIFSSLELEKIIQDFSETRQGKVIQQIICFYREVSESGLVTLSDLLQFMLGFKSKAPIERKTALALVAFSLHSSPMEDSEDHGIDIGQYSSKTAELDSRYATLKSCSDTAPREESAIHKNPPEYHSFAWLAATYGSRYSVRRLEEAGKAALDILIEKKTSFSRQDLRDAVKMSIGDTGLIDFTLKHINKVRMGDQIIRRCINPVTKMLEFSAQKLPEQEQPRKIKNPPQTSNVLSIKPGIDVHEDIFYLYENVLLGYAKPSILNWATEIVLDTKNFVKEWPLEHSFKVREEDQSMYIRTLCQVMPSFEELVADLTRPLPTPEVVIIHRNKTVKELKSLLEKALRDTYCIMESFEVTEVRNRELEMMNDDEIISSDNNVQIEVRGFGLDLCTELRYEGGFDNWTVDCKCGAKDDDGERMVACDSCKVWQHTKCNYIEDDEDAPSIYLCRKCIDVKVKHKKRSAENDHSSPNANGKKSVKRLS